MADAKQPPQTLGQWIDKFLDQFTDMRKDAANKAVDEAISEIPGKVRTACASLELIGGPEPAIRWLRGAIAAYQAELDSRLYDR